MPSLHAGEENGNFFLHWEKRVYAWHYNPQSRPEWLGDDEAFDLLQGVAAAWEACGVTLQYQGLTDKPPGVIDGENVVGWGRDGKRYSAWTNWAALRDGRAVEADVTLYSNVFDEYLRKGIDARLELYKSIAHEFGHVLGLGHSEQPEDAMSVRVRSRPEWPLPSENDIDRCRQVYSGQ